MKTAREYIESEYGTARFARTVKLNDVESLLDLMDDYAKFNRIEVAEQNKGSEKLSTKIVTP